MANRTAESELRNYEPTEFECDIAVVCAAIISLVGFSFSCKMIISAALIALRHG